MAEKPERYLILCVDRDDDLGVKTQIQTPISGREQVLAAANRLALADPEEADTNAVFAAVKKCDDLRRTGVDCEVAVVCGDQRGGFEADRKLKRGVDALLAAQEYSGIVFVSDGGDDENVMPILQSLKPIVSVERVTIRHSATVEQTYLVLGRYLRLLVYDPRYSKWALGVPGLILLLSGILIVANQIFEAELATVLILGGALFVRGFNVDRIIAGTLSRGPLGYVRLFSIVTSLLVTLVGVFSGYTNMIAQGGGLTALVAAKPSLIFTYGGKLTGYFLNGSLLLIWAGIAVYTMGALLSHMAHGVMRAWREWVVLVMLVLLYFPINTFATYLIGGQRESSILLVSYVLFGMAIIFGLTTTVFARVRTRASMAKE